MTTSSSVRLVLAPGRPDDEPLANAQHREMLLPGLRPVLFVDDARLKLADVAQLEGLQMAQVAPRRVDGGACAAAGSAAAM